MYNEGYLWRRVMVGSIIASGAPQSANLCRRRRVSGRSRDLIRMHRIQGHQTGTHTKQIIHRVKWIIIIIYGCLDSATPGLFILLSVVIQVYNSCRNGPVISKYFQSALSNYNRYSFHITEYHATPLMSVSEVLVAV